MCTLHCCSPTPPHEPAAAVGLCRQCFIVCRQDVTICGSRERARWTRVRPLFVAALLTHDGGHVKYAMIACLCSTTRKPDAAVWQKKLRCRHSMDHGQRVYTFSKSFASDDECDLTIMIHIYCICMFMLCVDLYVE